MSEYKTPNFSIDLSGQIALVTGASSGLGYRFSKVLASLNTGMIIDSIKLNLYYINKIW